MVKLASFAKALAILAVKNVDYRPKQSGGPD